MKKRLKKLFAGTILTISLLGSSLTVLASDCLENGHSFSTTRTYSHREEDHLHMHIDEVTGETHICMIYTYYYTVTQKCSKCNGIITIPGYVTSTVHVPY